MKSEMLGTNTSLIEVTHISRHGFWLLCQNKEYFLSFRQFPWFKKATIEQIHEVKFVSENHLYWSDLDVDLSLSIIETPEKFPLTSKKMKLFL